MVLSGLDFGGPPSRQGQTGSGDLLVRTIRQVAAALAAMAAMASAKHAAVNPERGDGVAAEADRALSRAMDALEQAVADAPLHRNLGDRDAPQSPMPGTAGMLLPGISSDETLPVVVRARYALRGHFRHLKVTAPGAAPYCWPGRRRGG
jgi:hypothetical protein